MKLALGLFVSLFVFQVYAGPEEHRDQQSCYGLAVESSVLVPPLLPVEICLEKIAVNVDTLQISIESYFQPVLFQGLKLSQWTRRNEDWFSFEASLDLVKRMNPDCNDGESMELHLSGRVDNLGEGNPAELAVSIIRQTTNDTCHSEPQTTIYTYRLK